MVTLERTYLDTAEVAKLVRRQLAAKFPGVKFQARISRYSVDIRWTDGPRNKDVKAVVEPFEGNGFDGSIDLAYSKDTWIMPDGSAQRAAVESTNGSRGTVEGYVTDAPHPNARLVRTTCWVSTRRDISNEREQIAQAEAYLRQHCRLDHYDYGDKFGNEWVSNIAINIANDRAEGESWEAPFRRVALREAK